MAQTWKNLIFLLSPKVVFLINGWFSSLGREGPRLSTVRCYRVTICLLCAICLLKPLVQNPLPISRKLPCPFTQLNRNKFLSFLQGKWTAEYACAEMFISDWSESHGIHKHILSSRIQGNKAHVHTVTMAPLPGLAFYESISNLMPLLFKNCSIVYLGTGEGEVTGHGETQWMEMNRLGTLTRIHHPHSSFGAH